MSVKAKQRYLCLDCNNAEIIECTKAEHKEVLECPICHGELVDVWHMTKYLPKSQHRIKEATVDINICVGKKAPLIQIELDTYGSVPRVFHKGKEITGKVSVKFRWETKDERVINSPFICIKHIDKSDPKGVPAIRNIEYRSIEEQG